MFGSALLSLAGVVLVLVFSLLDPVTRQAGNTAAEGSSSTIGGTGNVVADLALGFLLLTLKVLLAAGLLKALQTLISTPS